MKGNFLFLLFFLLAGLLCLHAQNFPNLRFSHLTTKDGLSTNQVSCAYRDSHGVMWFGTLKGLNRYDGSGFKVFLSRYKDSTSLPNNHIARIAEDKEGMLWLNADGILCRFDPSTEKVVAVYRDLQFTSFLIDSKKRLWVLGYVSVYRIDYNVNKVIEYTTPRVLLNSDRFGFLFLYEDRNKNLLAVTTRGICGIDTVSKKIIPAANKNYIPFNSLYEDHDQNFWAGIWPGGLQKISRDGIRVGPELLKDTICFSLEEWTDDEKNNFLLVAFDGGIRLVDPKTGTWKNYLPDKNYTESHNISTYPNLYRDPENRIWICHTNGVDIIDPFLQGVHNIYPISNKAFDHKWGNAISFVETRNDSKIALFNNNVLIVYDKKWEIKKNIHPFMPGDDKAHRSTIYDICAETDHRFLYATNKGLIEEGENGNGLVNIKPGIAFTHIITSDRNYYWALSVDSGVYRLSKTNQLMKQYPLADHDYLNICCDKENTIWIAARGGFYFYNAVADLFQFRKVDIENNGDKLILDAVADNGNIIWFVTKDVFASLNTRTGMIFSYNTSNGFTGSNLLNVATDNLGNVWVKSNTELICLHKATGLFTYFNEQSGLPVDNWKQQSVFHKMKNGDLIIGGENILTELNPALLLNNKSIPPVYLEDVEIDNLRTRIQSNGVGDKTILLKPGQTNFTAHFGLLNYTLPLKNKYYYKIAELEKEWHVSTDGNLSYNHLSPGTYHLLMKGSNNIGIEGSRGDSVIIIVKPFFYQTKWFYGLCGLLVIFIFWQLFQLREKRRLAQQRLRDKIARDLHDDVGSTLSGINLFSKMALQKMDEGKNSSRTLVEKIAERSENMVGAMSDIIWSVNSENDNIDKIIIRMRSYALDMLEEQSIKVNFSFPPNTAKNKIGLTVRKDFYLIYKEAVNNVAKYSNATEVNIILELVKGKLLMVIEDNGKGFDITGLHEGNGLKNMKARAATIRANFEIRSQKNSGTRIKLVMPI